MALRAVPRIHLTRRRHVPTLFVRYAAADHEQTAHLRFDFDFGELEKIPGRIDADMSVGMVPLVVNQSKASAAIAKCGNENRHVFFEGGEDDRVPVLGLLGKMA